MNSQRNKSDIVGATQGSSALPDFDLRGNKGKADETFALPLQNRMIGCVDPAEVGRAGV